MADYYRLPKTAVVEGLSSALCSIAFNREENNAPELNLTDEERHMIEDDITQYILSRFELKFKE